jgi:hypothetical protein
MSTTWDVRCADCDVSFEMEARDARYLTDLVEHAEAIAALAELDGYFQAFGVQDAVPAILFKKHHGHKLNIVNGYGDIWGTCMKSFMCDGCDSRKSCSRERGHDGPCGVRKVA